MNINNNQQKLPQTKSSKAFNPQNKCIRYFLFVNTKSGNKQGLKYLQLGTKKLTYVFKEGITSIIQIFDLFDKQRVKLAIEGIKKLSQQIQNNLRLIICGGDGTIPWVLNLVMQGQIKLQNVVFGILPIGTGNDFSRSIGWGYKTTQFHSKNLTKLHQIIKLWNKAQIGHYDIWDIQIETYENGAFYQIKNQQQVKIQQKILRRSFSNYFGIGLDGRIVYTVQKSRGANAFINKLLYTLVGAQKFFTPMQSIDNSISSFKLKKQLITKEEQQLMAKNQQLKISNTQATLQSVNNTLSSPLLNKIENQDSSQYQNQNQIHFTLKKGYKGLVCLNCTSYMCGLRNVWLTNKSTHQQLKLKNKSQQKQHFNDGNLQFMSFNNQLTLALQRVIRTGVRIAQGSGPFYIQFKKDKESNITYMQIDGQSVKIQFIKCIKVKRSIRYPQSRINVLINKQE